MVEEFTEIEKRMLVQMNEYAKEIIHGKAADAVVQRLRAGDDPVEAMAMMGAELTKTVERVVEDSIGEELSEGLLYATGQNIINLLTEVALAAGLFEEDEAVMMASHAYIEAVRMYAEQTRDAGEVSVQKRDAANRDLAMLMPQGQQPPAQGAAPAQGQPMPSATPAKAPGLLVQ